MKNLFNSIHNRILLLTILMLFTSGCKWLGNDTKAVDTTIPVISLTGSNPQTIEVDNVYTELGATATDDVDGDITSSIIIDASAVDTTTIGSYSVTYNVSDAAGNTASTQTRTVEVVADATAPNITLTGANPQTIEYGVTYTELGATATDNVDGDITANISIDASTVDTTTLGSYSVTYNVSDAAGNAATTQTRTINVVDTTVPVITLTGVNPQIVEIDTDYTELGATASDNVDGDITANITIDSSAVDTSTVGNYNVTYNVSDASGNVAVTKTRTVNVASATVSASGQAILGPISGADYAIYDIANFTTPLATGITSGGTDLNQIGRIYPNINLFNATQLYLVTITNGADVDVDDNLVIDVTPSPLENTIHAIISGEQLIGDEGWQVTVLTEVAYQQVKFLLENGSGAATILAALDDIAKQLVSADLNGDGNIDATDLNLWHPTINRSQSLLSLSERTSLNLQLLNGSAVTLDDAKLTGEIASYISSTGGWANDIALEGNTAYIATDSCYLVQVDMSDITNLQTLDQYYIPNCNRGLSGVRLYNGNIYLTDKNDDYFVYTASTPLTTSSFQSSYLYDSNADDTSIIIDGVTYPYIGPRISHKTPFIGNYAYVPTYTFDPTTHQQVHALMILNISDPAVFNPVTIVVPNTSFKENCSITTQSSMAYMLCAQELALVNLETPTSPQIQPAVLLPIDSTTIKRLAISANGLYLYVTGTYSFYVIDLADYSLISEIALSGQSVTANMELVDNMIYAPTNAGIEIVDVTDPLTTKHLGVIDRKNEEYIGSITSLDNLLLVTGGNNEQFVALSKTPAPALAGVTASMYDDPIFAIELSGKFGTGSNNYLYTGSKRTDGVDGGQFNVVDISTPENPVVVGSVNIPNYTWFGSERAAYVTDIKAEEDLAYALTTGGIYSINISVPANPTIVAYLDQASNLYTPVFPMAFSAPLNGGRTLYHASRGYNAGDYRVQVGDAFYQPDITDGNSISLAGAPKGISVNSVSTGIDRLYIYDSGNGQSKVQSWLIDTTGTAVNQLTLAGVSEIVAYVEDIDSQANTVFTISNQELTILDASNNSFEGGVIATHPTIGYEIEADGNTVYVSGGMGGLISLDITNLSEPKLSMQINTDGRASKLTTNDDFVVFTEQGKGLHIVKKATHSVP